MIDLAIEEDVYTGDVTTDSIVPESTSAVATMTAKADGVISGLPVVEKVFRRFQEDIVFKPVDTDIYPVIHLEVVDAFHLLPPLWFDCMIIRDNHTYIIFILVKCLRKTSYNICKSSCLYERNAFRSCEEYFLHLILPVLFRIINHYLSQSQRNIYQLLDLSISDTLQELSEAV